MRILIFMILFCGFTSQLLAADSIAVRKKFFLSGLNAVAYKGSLSPNYTRWTPAFQFGIRFQKKKILNGMLSLSFGKVIGESRDYKIPANTKPNITPVNRFETSFFSLQYEVQILLFHYKTFRIIASQGIGLFRFSPSDWDGNSLIDRDRTRNTGESYSVNVLQFPSQIGLQYGFSNGMALGFQAGLINPNTEYIDNMDALSNSDQKDNMAIYRMQFFVPLR